jgi:uncharacterized protein YegP (UPF0339 family)
MNQPVFKITKPTNKFYFSFNGHDGFGEAYEAKQGAETGIASVKANCGDRNNYDLRETTDDRFYFVLQAQNNEIIYTGKFCKTIEEREEVIGRLMEFGLGAETVIDIDK